MIVSSWQLMQWTAEWFNSNAVARGQQKPMERDEPYILEVAFDLEHFSRDLISKMDAPE